LDTPESVTAKVVGAVKWSGLMEIGSRAVSATVYLVMARLLAPDDFGIMAIGMIIVNFSNIFLDAGLEKALIQTSSPSEKAAHVIFWTNVFMGLVIFSLLILAAPPLAAFFHCPASVAVIRVLSLQVLTGSLASVQQALLVRKFGFRELFWVKMATAIASGGLAIPLAFFKYGVWALVAGSLTGSLLNLILLWAQNPWCPRFSFHWPLARSLYGFGIWVALEGLGTWFFFWGDNLLVAKILGPHALGIYSVAWNIVNLIFGLVLNPFYPVLYPTFSRLRENLPLLTETFHRASHVVMALTLPIGTLLLLTGPALVSVFFGDKWQGMGIILALIGFMEGLSWLGGINPELYRACGRPDLNTKLMFGTILYYLPAYLLAAPWGLVVFTGTRMGLELTIIPLHIYLGVRLLKGSPHYLWRHGVPVILATLVMVAVLIMLQRLVTLPQTLSWLTLLIGTGLLIYSVVLWKFDRPFVSDMTNLIKRTVLS
jgi:O-antigen/teichoic acid export membrane protein